MVRAAALTAALALFGASGASCAPLTPDFYPGASDPFSARAPADFLQRNGADLKRLGALILEYREHPEERGCANRPVFECIATLAQTFPIGSEVFDDPQARHMNWPFDAQTDINGKPLVPPEVALTILTGDVVGRPIIFLTVDQDGVVRSVMMPLLSNVLSAQTYDDYEATKVYEMAAAVLEPGCHLPDRTTFYRLIENEAKPHEKGDSSTDASMLGISENNFLRAPFQVCDYTLSAEFTGGESTEDVTLDNPHGVSVMYSLTISRAQSAAPASVPTAVPSSQAAPAAPALKGGRGCIRVPTDPSQGAC
ncbi:MAG TPA: hypothetical protein VMU37_09780 [Caulobacteraceae bacterium]|nr:hypothetical protein [Caulobacteraceae bacterium]